MASQSLLAPRPSRRRGLLPLLVGVSCVAIVVAFVPRYLAFDPHDTAVPVRNLEAVHFPLLLVHIFCGTVALTLGAVQFSARLRRRAPRVHRLTGRVYLFAGVLPASVAGFGVALLTTSGPVAAVAFGGLAVYWFVTAVAAFLAARAHRYADHAAWMYRNFAATFAAVTLRAWLGLGIAVQLPLLHGTYHDHFQDLFTVAYLCSAWLAWVPNVLFIEFYLRRRRSPGVTPTRARTVRT